ncbi:hypothetical protein [Pseudomonas sp. COW5]|uniref:hypothetical protein n=1 Tax=Pseudomonas sp. COW5 TaxID=2981253 RepID=UPI002245E704|nr:hypothetical protein [Pseudomonas sp. COW5]MCX2546582.1 hypothetical protein [Pseudomonas sp. COW5]
MSTDNRDQFNLMVLRILTDLVAACPSPVAITAKTYNLPEGEDVSEGEGIYAQTHYRQSQEEQLLSNTLKWLREEGFVRLDNAYGYVATIEALKLWNAVPKALSE